MAAYGSNTGLFVPNTWILDVQKVNATNVNSQEFKELLVRLYQNLAIMNDALNMKVSGYYINSEFVTSKQYYPSPTSIGFPKPFRSTYSYVVDFGALPNTGTKSVPHGLAVNSQWIWTEVYATATDQTNLVGMSINAANATVTVNATDVTITTTANLSSFNVCMVILEYIKFG